MQLTGWDRRNRASSAIISSLNSTKQNSGLGGRWPGEPVESPITESTEMGEDQARGYDMESGTPLA
jgi:hypothetical protein